MAESLRSPPEELNSVRIEDLISFDDCDDCDDGLLDYSIRDHIDFNDSLINQGEAPDGEAHTLNTSVGEVADAGEACGLLQGSVGRGNDKANTNDNELDSLINQGEVPGGEAHTLDTSVGEVADAGEACGLLQGSVGRGNDKVNTNDNELDSLINQGKYLDEVADAGEACGLLQGSVGRRNDAVNTNDNSTIFDFHTNTQESPVVSGTETPTGVLKPKRYKCAYSWFISDGTKIIKENFPSLSAKEVKQEVGKLWRSLTDEEKEQHVQLAAPGKKLYDIKMLRYRRQKETVPNSNGKEKNSTTTVMNRKEPKRSEVSEVVQACRSLIAVVNDLLINIIPVPVEKWMAVLNTVPELDANVKVAAINFLEGNPTSVRTFMSLDVGLRKMWNCERCMTYQAKVMKASQSA
ncbi:hypothetical protein C5167_033808 [Papaver somniferum]|uniref:HMG box domain-containing protein n=1 Tax=Papaver somniferum TaxID=3469 RepID=A0A4Y7KFC9_PAPSO|nr:hypothetical protein C5167_033808 [Papaver somniferum]